MNNKDIELEKIAEMKKILNRLEEIQKSKSQDVAEFLILQIKLKDLVDKLKI